MMLQGLLRGRTPRVAIATIAMITLASTAAAQSILDLVPGNAAVVVHVRGLESSLKNVENMVDAMVEGEGKNFADNIREELELDKFGTAGLPKNTPMVLAIVNVSPDQVTPAMAAIAKVDDYKKFLDGFAQLSEMERGETTDGVTAFGSEFDAAYVTKMGDYVVIASTMDVLKAMKSEKKPALPKSAVASMAQADVAMFANMKTINEQAGDTITMAEQQVMMGLQMSAAMMPPSDSPLMKSQRAQIQSGIDMVKSLFQMIKDAEYVVLAGDASKAGMKLTMNATVGKDTETAKTFAKGKPGKLTALRNMPQGQFMYMVVSDAGLMETASGLMNSQMQAFMAGESAKKVADAMGEMTGMAFSAGLEGGVNGVAVYEVKDAKKVKADMVAASKALGDGDMAALGIKSVKVEEEAGTYDEISFDRVSVELDYDAMNQMMPGLGDMQKGMMGEAVSSYYGATDDVVMQITAADWPSAKAKLDALLKGEGTIGNNKAINAAIGKLPGSVSMAGVVDVPGMAIQAMSMVGPMLGMPPMDDVKADSGYLAFSGTMVENTMQMTVWVASESIANTVKAFTAMAEPVEGEMQPVPAEEAAPVE